MARRQRDLGFLAERWDDLKVAWRLVMDPEVSPTLKLIPVLAALYFLSPIDLIPDVLIGPGQLDDVGIVLLALAAFLRFAPADRVARARGDLSGDGEWVEGEAHRRD